MYNEDDYLMLSGLQHFSFCRRQWALIHIEKQWQENLYTTEGNIIHERVHDGSVHEKRKKIIKTNAMNISSSRLGISGKCDLVEFHRCNKGITLFGVEGKYRVVPVEYKSGEPKEGKDCDVLQLTAQALCLEDMLCCEIKEGYIYYDKTRHRMKIIFDEAIRKRTEEAITEMHELYRKRHTPLPKRTKSCNACSLKEICLPQLEKRKKASEYIKDMLYKT